MSLYCTVSNPIPHVNLREHYSWILIICYCRIVTETLYLHEERTLRLNRKCVRGQHRCNERRAVDASTKRMHTTSTGIAIIIFTSECRNSLRDQCEAALHGSQMGEESSFFRRPAVQRSGNDYTEFIRLHLYFSMYLLLIKISLVYLTRFHLIIYFDIDEK